MSDRIQSVSLLYPGLATGQEGIFVHQRLSALPERFSVRVWRARPWFPLRSKGGSAGSEMVDAIPVDDVPFFYLPGVFKGLDGSWMLRALKRLPTDGVDLIDAHFGYPTGWAAVKLAKERRLPVVVTFRGTEVSQARVPALRERLVDCVSGADRIICVSEPLAQLARDLGASPDRVKVIGNGIDPQLFHPGNADPGRTATSIPPGVPVLLTVGGLSERKGVARVLEILPRLVKSHGDLLYLVVGGASPEGDETARIKALAVKLGVEDSIRLLGARPFAEIPDLYRAADVFVLATRHEGCANVLGEAVACGLHVVATDVGGNRSVLREGDAGTLVPFGDAPALEAAVSAAIASAKQEGPRQPVKVPTWAAIGNQVGEVFEELIEGVR